MPEAMQEETRISTINPPSSSGKDQDTTDTETKGTEVDSGASSIPDRSAPEHSDLLSTLDVKADKSEEKGETGKEESVDESSKETKTEEGDKSAETKEKSEDTRYDKDPRFQELITQRNTFRERAAKAEQELQTIKDQENKEVKKDFTDIMDIDDDDLREKFDKDPKAFLANFGRQIATEVKEDVLNEVKTTTRQESLQNKINEGYEDFGNKNPDFWEKVDDGSIKALMDREPWHNAISAYMSITSADKEKSFEERLEQEKQEAVSEALDKQKKDILVKREANVLGEGPGGGGTASTTESQVVGLDSKKHGGIARTLLNRLQERRRQVM